METGGSSKTVVRSYEATLRHITTETLTAEETSNAFCITTRLDRCNIRVLTRPEGEVDENHTVVGFITSTFHQILTGR
jgi:hypothetical protein